MAVANGNVGIGTAVPGAELDVGTYILLYFYAKRNQSKCWHRLFGPQPTSTLPAPHARQIFTMTAQTPISGYVLTASDSAGDATWASAGGVSGWTSH